MFSMLIPSLVVLAFLRPLCNVFEGSLVKIVFDLIYTHTNRVQVHVRKSKLRLRSKSHL